ncbi:hypothetical protein SDC9_45680 [bioreactor metagenome]|uniref:Uncharacterized protein n=1 Tax=bioreactor metagenome TaxID=1076179 RepID=A0A644WA72_9ZZZZ
MRRGSRRPGLVIGVGKDAFYALHLVVLGKILEDSGELSVLQHLHVVFGRSRIGGEDIGNLLGASAEILGHFMNTIFDKTQMSHLRL